MIKIFFLVIILFLFFNDPMIESIVSDIQEECLQYKTSDKCGKSSKKGGPRCVWQSVVNKCYPYPPCCNTCKDIMDCKDCPPPPGVDGVTFGTESSRLKDGKCKENYKWSKDKLGCYQYGCGTPVVPDNWKYLSVDFPCQCCGDEDCPSDSPPDSKPSKTENNKKTKENN